VTDYLIPVVKDAQDIVVRDNLVVVNLILDNPIRTNVASLSHKQVLKVKTLLDKRPHRVIMSRVIPTGNTNDMCIPGKELYGIDYVFNGLVIPHLTIIIGGAVVIPAQQRAVQVYHVGRGLMVPMDIVIVS
jgi:hypothetical protein